MPVNYKFMFMCSINTYMGAKMHLSFNHMLSLTVEDSVIGDDNID